MQMRLLLSLLVPFTLAMPAMAAETVHVLDKEGQTREGSVKLAAITIQQSNGGSRKIPLSAILSVHSAEPASAGETARIEAGIAAIQAYKNEVIASDVRKKRDDAVEDLTAIGLPVVTPLLRTLKDTDQHEPRPLYRLFARLMPVEADQLDRDASLVRLANGEYVRGKVQPFTLEIGGSQVEWSNIRRLAVRRKSVTRRMELHSLQHSTQIEYLDTGIVAGAGSQVNSRAKGFVRLSWDIDGWASGPNGLQVPGPKYKTNLVDQHPFGAIVGRNGASGDVFFVGETYQQASPAAGRLYLAVNDNRHWQNNVGAFRVTLQASQVYDVGDAQ
jgi:hypothetical protein